MSDRDENRMDEDPNCWKLGLFYVNPKDKRLFVPKRFGFGLTMNFGNPNAMIVIAGVIALICFAIR